MSKLSNALLMLEYLENGKKYSVKELAEKLELTERMVRSYREELEQAGIYIDTIMGPYGGYVLRKNIKLPTRKITEEDYNFLKDLKLNKKDSVKLNQILKKLKEVYLDYENIDISTNGKLKNTYNILNKAIKENKKVKINYYSFVNGNQDRVIRPYDMFLYNTGWGCAAYCELKNDLRHFELKRINSIELLNEKF